MQTWVISIQKGTDNHFHLDFKNLHLDIQTSKLPLRFSL